MSCPGSAISCSKIGGRVWVFEIEQEEAASQGRVVVSQAVSCLPHSITGVQNTLIRRAKSSISGSV